MSVAFVNEPSGLRSSPVRERVTMRESRVLQQDNRGGKRDNKTEIVYTKMRNKKTMKNESPSMESWNRIGERPEQYRQ